MLLPNFCKSLSLETCSMKLIDMNKKIVEVEKPSKEIPLQTEDNTVKWDAGKMDIEFDSLCQNTLVW